MPILRMRVAHPPKERPVMLYDGDCSFCRRSAFFLRGLTHSQVDFAIWQRSWVHFPEIDKRYYADEVKLVSPSGYVYGGAEAILMAMTYSSGWGWVFWLYSHLPPVRWVGEMVYKHYHKNRQHYSKKVGPFWMDWDSGGKKYETYEPKRTATIIFEKK